SSSFANVTPFPIFSLSGAQSLKSYLGFRPFQLIKFNSFVHPFADSDSTPMVANISYLISATLSTAYYRIHILTYLLGMHYVIIIIKQLISLLTIFHN